MTRDASGSQGLERDIVRKVPRSLRARILKPFWLLLAALFLFEAWLWEKLKPIVARLVGLLPLKALRAGLERLIRWAPAPLVLLIFAIPAGLLIPIKIAALWFLARGHLVFGAGMFVLAKLVGVGVAAYLFEMTRAKLMTMAWFARFYALVMRVSDWAHAQIEPFKQRIRAWKARIEGERGGRVLRFLSWLRRRAAKRAVS